MTRHEIETLQRLYDLTLISDKTLDENEYNIFNTLADKADLNNIVW